MVLCANAVSKGDWRGVSTAMTDIPAAPILPHMPYRGIEPFRYVDQPIFFARAQETRKLLRSITIYRGVLLYGASGTGKSSLINAGVIPVVRPEGFAPHRLRVQPIQGSEIIVERIPMTTEGQRPYLPSIFVDDSNPAAQVVLSLATFAERLQAASADSAPLLIFDQFEEFITLFEESLQGKALRKAQAVQQEITTLLLRLLRDHSLPIKLLFVFREDYLAKLSKLFVQSPDLTDHYLRLTAPLVNMLPMIIRGPFLDQALRQHFGKELSDELARKVMAKIEKSSAGGGLNLSEVQIVCLELWRSENPESLFKQRGVQGVLEDYLDRAINLLGSDHLRDPALALLSFLITPSGTRNIVAEDDLITRVNKEEQIATELLRTALKALEIKTKLVRRELRYKTYFYELVSEFLVPWVANQKAARSMAIEHRRLDETSLRTAGAVPGAIGIAPDPHHLEMLRQDLRIWHAWRRNNPTIAPTLARADLAGRPLRAIDLSDANLSQATLDETDLRDALLRSADLTAATLQGADLTGANLGRATLRGARLDHAKLRQAQLRDANLMRASLVEADLRGADLTHADLTGADLTGANLSGASLSYATLVDTNLKRADMTGCTVIGITLWDMNLEGADQSSLVISDPDEPSITVDDLGVAPFVGMLLKSSTIQQVFTARSSKAVLLLGNFAQDRMDILETMLGVIRGRGYVPMVINVDRAYGQDIAKTIDILISLSRFVIADFSGVSSPLELLSTLAAITIPFVPLIHQGERVVGLPVGMQPVLAVPFIAYTGPDSLSRRLPAEGIDAAEQKYQERQLLLRQRLGQAAEPTQPHVAPVDVAQPQSRAPSDAGVEPPLLIASPVEATLSDEQKQTISNIVQNYTSQDRIRVAHKDVKVLAQDPELNELLTPVGSDSEERYLDLIELGQRIQAAQTGARRFGGIARYLLRMLQIKIRYAPSSAPPETEFGV
ncbi:MAG TPA: pentapeptide repeat-containing protein [Herpetosiphonaceae bacterium]